MHFDSVIEVLKEADLVEERRGKLYEKVRQIDFGENYERVGDIWQLRKKDSREDLTVRALDELVEFPQLASELGSFSGATGALQKQVLEVASNARLIETLSVGIGEPMLFAPMLWGIDPEACFFSIRASRERDPDSSRSWGGFRGRIQERSFPGSISPCRSRLWLPRRSQSDFSRRFPLIR